MLNDMAERLRRIADHQLVGKPHLSLKEAADEIERLRAIISTEPERMAVAVGEEWPSDADLRQNDRVTTQRKPFYVGRIAGWYRNTDGRLGYAVEADAIPGLIHVYPEHALIREGSGV